MSSSLARQRVFQEIFARPPVLVARSPGRVNLIGEHVDYNQGLVMPIAVDRFITCSAAPIDSPEVRLWSSCMAGDPLIFPLNDLQPVTGERSWANYVLGVIAEYRHHGVDIGGFEAAIEGNLPVGAGLSSSAALESVTALVVEGLHKAEISSLERCRRCQAAEHAFAGVPCGLMDQLAVNHGQAGHALMIDCRSLQLTAFPLPDTLSIVMVNSGVRHALADGEYGQRKADCEAAAALLGLDTLRDASLAQVADAKKTLGDRLFRRARHVVSEIGRVKEFAQALNDADHQILAALMNASHASLRDDYQVSCSELDALVDLAPALGAVGSRMTGAGFGGCTINLVPRQDVARFCQEMPRAYRARYGTAVEAFVVKPVDGAAREWLHPNSLLSAS